MIEPGIGPTHEVNEIRRGLLAAYIRKFAEQSDPRLATSDIFLCALEKLLMKLTALEQAEDPQRRSRASYLHRYLISTPFLAPHCARQSSHTRPVVHQDQWLSPSLLPKIVGQNVWSGVLRKYWISLDASLPGRPSNQRIVKQPSRLVDENAAADRRIPV